MTSEANPVRLACDGKRSKLLSVLNRYMLPGLAFKAVVIGGGYATGRELAEFFLPSGPTGGLLGILLAMGCWSAICVLTFSFAYRIGAHDYQSFFSGLLGRFAFVFEIFYFADLILILSIFGSAAGAICAAIAGWPLAGGALLLVSLVSLVCWAGQRAAESLFKYVSVLLYGVYFLFLVLTLMRFEPAIRQGFSNPVSSPSWIAGGVTYAGYNVMGAVLILPVLRHLRSGRDAILAGLLAGPLAMAPAIAFFVCLAAFYPAVVGVALPSDLVLKALNIPLFHLLFQLMVFCALLESSVGFVQAFNARIEVFNQKRGRVTSQFTRILVPATILTVSVFAATMIGLTKLIAQGYRVMALGVLIVYILPLFTVGLFKLIAQQDRIDREIGDLHLGGDVLELQLCDGKQRLTNADRITLR